MDLDLGPEIEHFRHELRDWIAEHAPPALAGLIDWQLVAIPGGYRAQGLAEAPRHPAYAEWQRALAGARLICPQWPAEFGGQGVDAVRIAVLNEEFHRAGVPRVAAGQPTSAAAASSRWACTATHRSGTPTCGCSPPASPCPGPWSTGCWSRPCGPAAWN